MFLADSVLMQPQNVFIFICAAIELLTNLACFPLCAFNLFLISQTSVIHANIKHILLAQSGCILGRAMCRFSICLLKFILLRPMDSEKYMSITTPYSFFICIRNSLVHILIIERVLAAFMVKSYERRQKPYFTLAWIVVVLSLSLYNSIGYEAKGLANLLTNVALLCTAGIELILFSALRLHNQRAYSQHNATGHNLSERYQLSENIRVGKQIMPTLVFHLFNIMSSTLITSWNYFVLPDMQYVLVSCAIFSSLCSVMIEITTIMCHPFLKRSFINILNGFNLSTLRSNQVSNNEAAVNGTGNIAMTNILNGEAFLTGQGQEEHFDMLNKMWR